MGSVFMLRQIVHKAKILPGRTAELIEDTLSGWLVRYDIADVYQRIYLYHVQKTGGTSLNHIFLSLGGEDSRAVYDRLGKENGRRRTVSGGKIYVGWDKRLIERGHYFYAFSHLPKYRLNLPAKTFTITCLRDPKQRVLSQYKEYLAFRINNIQHADRVFSDKWLGSSFGDFLKNIPKETLLQQLYMFSHNFDVAEAVESILSCSFFFRTEQFDAGCAELSKKLVIPFQPIHLRKAPIEVDIPERDLKCLESAVEPEYRLLEALNSANGFGVSDPPIPSTLETASKNAEHPDASIGCKAGKNAF